MSWVLQDPPGSWLHLRVPRVHSSLRCSLQGPSGEQLDHGAGSPGRCGQLHLQRPVVLDGCVELSLSKCEGPSWGCEKSHFTQLFSSEFSHGLSCSGATAQHPHASSVTPTLAGVLALRSWAHTAAGDWRVCVLPAGQWGSLKVCSASGISCQ